MDFFRDKYKNVTGRTDSMYIYILYNCSQDKLKEHVKKQLEIIDKISDSFKRKLFSSRYYLIRDMVESNLLIDTYDCILFVGDDISSHHLTKDNMALLKRYEHQNISYIYDNHYDLNYLEDLLYNTDPYHVYRVNNNKIDYIQMTKTKKLLINSKEAKPLDIQDFVNRTLPSNSRYIIHGISSKLKEIVDPKAYCIVHKHLRDDEVIEMTDQIDQEDILSGLATDILMIQDIKQLHKVVFKKEIFEKIKMSQLEKLYIDLKLYDKFMENMKKHNLDFNFKLMIINTSIKGFVEGREKLIDMYGGVVGITYY
jgi:hypothetical protein